MPQKVEVNSIAWLFRDGLYNCHEIVSDTAMPGLERTRNLFRHKRTPIPLYAIQ